MRAKQRIQSLPRGTRVAPPFRTGITFSPRAGRRGRSRRLPCPTRACPARCSTSPTGHDIEIDHACGGVCACSTCHVILREAAGDAGATESRRTCSTRPPARAETRRAARPSRTAPATWSWRSPAGTATTPASRRGRPPPRREHRRRWRPRQRAGLLRGGRPRHPDRRAGARARAARRSTSCTRSSTTSTCWRPARRAARLRPRLDEVPRGLGAAFSASAVSDAVVAAGDRRASSA